MSSYITKMHDRMDRIAYDRYGNSNNRIVEWLFEQNPGVEQHGIILPPGITINLPEPPRNITAPPLMKQIFLWD